MPVVSFLFYSSILEPQVMNQNITELSTVPVYNTKVAPVSEGLQS